MERQIKELAAVAMVVLGKVLVPSLMANNDTSFSLAKRGIELHFGLMSVYQYNLSGGLESGLGRHADSNDLELDVDLERLAGWKGGTSAYAR